MATKASAKPRAETPKEWAAAANRDKYVTRGELLFWIDRLEDYRAERAKEERWYRVLWRRITGGAA